MRNSVSVILACKEAARSTLERVAQIIKMNGVHAFFIFVLLLLLLFLFYYYYYFYFLSDYCVYCRFCYATRFTDSAPFIYLSSRDNPGKVYASALPHPREAITNISVPLINRGMAADCSAIGAAYPLLLKLCSTSCGNA